MIFSKERWKCTLVLLQNTEWLFILSYKHMTPLLQNDVEQDSVISKYGTKKKKGDNYW